MTDTIRTRLDALSEADRIWVCDECGHVATDDGMSPGEWGRRCYAHPRSSKPYRCEAHWTPFVRASIADVTADSDLIPRDEVEGLIEALVSAAEAVDIDTQLDYGNGDDLNTWLVQRCNLDALRVAKNAAVDYLASIQTEEEK